jgi:hypothetical protein
LAQAYDEPAAALRQRAFGFITARSIYAVAKLGIADLLKDGAQSIEELSLATESNADALYRVMRTLSGEGVFREDDGRRFSLTPISQLLRTDMPDSLCAYIVMNHGVQYQAWKDVLHSIATGEAAVLKTFGQTWGEILRTNPEHRDIFHAAMKSSEQTQNPGLARVYDFSKAKVVADIGGGNGSLLSTILTQHEHLSGILLDIEPAIKSARAGGRGSLPRCETVIGDFFKEVPPGADVYVLKRVLHDWDDDSAISILSNCRRAMPSEGRILIIETLVGLSNEPSWGKLQDLSMLITTGGKERSETEFANIFSQAVLRLIQILSTPSDLKILVAACA